MLFVESGGDNLAANYSRELADYIIYVSLNATTLLAIEADPFFMFRSYAVP